MPPLSPNLPSVEKVLNTLRAVCNDSFAGATNTPGEGQILTDAIQNTTNPNPYVLNLFNSSLRELYRKLRLSSDPSLIQDNFLLIGVPVVNGPLGPSTNDPTVQTYLDYIGYFDGTSYHNSFQLPPDMLNPLRLWERESTTTDTFMEMTQSQDGLPARNQTDRLQEWEWRSSRINFVGATTVRDVRIRYQLVLPEFFPQNVNFSTLFIPIQDCEEYLAYKTAEKVSLSLGNPQISASLMTSANNHLFDLKMERVKRDQQQNYHRQAYEDNDLANTLDDYGI